MAQLIVRNIGATVKSKLQERAAKHGRSMEEEVRDILRNAVKGDSHAPKGLGSRIAARFKGLGITQEIQELRGYPVRPANLDE